MAFSTRTMFPMAERLTGREIIDPRAAADRENTEKSIMEGSSGRPAPARNAGNAGRGGPALPKKTNRRDEKMAMSATQQPQRGGTTSCASRPSAGIDRAKCLISLKATGETETILCTVSVPPRWYQVTLSPADPGRGVAYGT